MALWDLDLLLLCNIALGLIFVSATALNCLVFLVFYKRRGLRKLSNRFVMNMSAVNLVSCWTLPLIVLVSPTSEASCAVGRGLATGLCAASVLSVLLIGFDQYLAILDPLHYPSRITSFRSWMFIVCCWLLSVAVGVAGAEAGCWPCASVRPRSPIFAAIFAMSFFGIVFFLPFGLLCWIYASIYSAARTNSRKHGFVSSQGYIFVPIERKAYTSYIVDNLRHRFSNASMFRYREESRAARVSALVIATGLACWFPFSLMILLESPVWGLSLPPLFARAGVTLLALSSVLSALLFAHRNRRIRSELYNILGLDRKKNRQIIVSRLVEGNVGSAQLHVLGSSFSSAASTSSDVSLAESI